MFETTFEQTVLRDVEKTLWDLESIIKEFGKILKFAKERKIYKHWGEPVKHWNQYCDAIGISVSEAKSFIDMYDLMEKNKQHVSPSRMKKILRYHKFGSMSLDEWMGFAECAPHKDFMDEINKIKGKKSYLECGHEKTEAYQRCETCGKWFKEGTHEEGVNQ